jgi:hypothetical protein
LDVDDIVLYCAFHPSRRKLGPLPNEIQWETVSHEGGSPTPLISIHQLRSVRRVARFLFEVVSGDSSEYTYRIILNRLVYVDASRHCSNNLSKGD